MNERENSQVRNHIHELDDKTSLYILDEGDIHSDYSRLLIQGLGCAAETIWRPLLTQLNLLGESRRHIAFDVRGIGKSSGWPVSIEQMADDAAFILSCLKISSVEVVGHSLGGAISIIMAVQAKK